MAPIRNARLLFSEVLEIGQGYPIPGKTTTYDSSQTIDLDDVSLDGSVLIKTLVLSIDPMIREMFSTQSHYNFTLGQPVVGFGVGIVIRSENPVYKPGDHLYGFLGFQEYNIVKDVSGLRILKNEANLPWSLYIGILGMPGQTGYYGWKEYANALKGDVAYVTTAAGPVGSLVVQLAKRDGLKVIASAGSDEKVKFLKEIGADVAFNYKTTDIREVLAKEGPINLFWDHVGGETLEIALDSAAQRATFIECGMISGYNDGPKPISNLFNIIRKELRIYGLIITSLDHKYGAEFRETVPAMVARGELKYLEHVTKGLEHAEEAIVGVLRGENVGKSVIMVAEN